MLDGAMAYTMTGRIETAMSCTTTLMADFTFIKAVSTVFIITFRKTSKDITRSDIASITNNIIAIMLSRQTNIRDIPDIPRERKDGGNETSYKEEWRYKP
jgi:hypothetical protein